MVLSRTQRTTEVVLPVSEMLPPTSKMPPDGIASTAFLIRLTKTSINCCSFPITQGSLGATRSSALMFSGILTRSRASLKTLPTLTGSGSLMTQRFSSCTSSAIAETFSETCPINLPPAGPSP